MAPSRGAGMSAFPPLLGDERTHLRQRETDAIDPEPTSTSPSPNDLVGFHQDFGRDVYAKLPSGLKVDCELVRQRGPHR